MSENSEQGQFASNLRMVRRFGIDACSCM